MLAKRAEEARDECRILYQHLESPEAAKTRERPCWADFDDSIFLFDSEQDLLSRRNEVILSTLRSASMVLLFEEDDNRIGCLTSVAPRGNFAVLPITLGFHRVCWRLYYVEDSRMYGTVASSLKQHRFLFQHTQKFQTPPIYHSMFYAPP